MQGDINQFSDVVGVFVLVQSIETCAHGKNEACILKAKGDAVRVVAIPFGELLYLMLVQVAHILVKEEQQDIVLIDTAVHVHA